MGQRYGIELLPFHAFWHPKSKFVHMVAPMGLDMGGPVIMGHGGTEQKDFYLPRILTAAASPAKLRRVAAGDTLEDPLFANKIAAVAIKQQAAEFTEHRVIADIVRQGRPSAESPIMKVLGSETNQAMTELTVEALNDYAAPFQTEARTPGEM